MRLHELTGTATTLAELPEILAVLVEPDEAMADGRVVMALGDENVAVRQRDQIIGLIERGGIGRLSRLVAACFPQRQQKLAVGANLYT
jgi:hypothetical protein